MDYTVVRLRTVSLLPETVIEHLRRRFGKNFDELDEHGRLALVTAHIEGFVSNARLQQIIRLHPRDITLLLAGMVQKSMLESDGTGRGTTYRVTGNLSDSPTHLPSSSTHLADSSTHLENGEYDPCQDSKLLQIAQEVRAKGKTDKSILTNTILALCTDRFLSIQQIGTLLQRSPAGLRERFIKPMLEEGLLERRFPHQPSHEQQAYRTRKDRDE